MTKEEINKTIFSLQTDEEIIDFVKKRIQELENNSIETTVGQNHTTTFREYILEKTHYKAVAKLKDAECPDLVYDDITPYINLIKSIKKNKWYNELTLFSIIFFEVYNYLPSDDIGLGRALTYLGNRDKRISIKQIRENACAFCSEKSGMSHNMFKFLGIDSEVVCGYRDLEKHAYNIIYPNGYWNEPMVIYDSSFFVNFIKGNQKLSFGYFKALRREDYQKLMSGLPLKMDLSKTEKNYRQLYKLSEEYTFEGDTPNYIAGLNKKKEIPGDSLINDLYYSTHLENGVESVPYKK
ncbi:MAG: hypothetical protein U0M66_01555 [Bacilli bacterium]|nr:hypothetical protein [Bacilli bacterium]